MDRRLILPLPVNLMRFFIEFFIIPLRNYLAYRQAGELSESTNTTATVFVYQVFEFLARNRYGFF